jgi:moderate conductance mechanosensitive channel
MVGDYVKFGDFTGKVIELGLKCTKIKSLENGILIVANRNVTEVINYSQTKADIQIRIPVAYEENDAKVTKAIADTLKNIKNIKGCIPETVTSYGIVQLNNSSVDYLIGFLCNPEYQFKAKRDALKIIKETMDVSNVKIPYNQIEVHNGKNI